MKLIIIVLSSFLLSNELVTCQVTKVTDGDSFTCGKYTVRLAGVDAPEYDHKYGNMSSYALRELIGGKTVELDIIKKGYFNRSIAYVYLGEIDVNEYLLMNGYVKCYRKSSHKYLREYSRIEKLAQLTKIGVWK